MRPQLPRAKTLSPDTPLTPPLGDADLARLEHLLSSLDATLQPLDLSALDGYLCGVLLQPQSAPLARWWPHVADVTGRAAPDSPALRELQQQVLRRHAELNGAIQQRQWFDPWIFADDEATAGDGVQAVLPWVAGFAAAMEHFPQLMDSDNAELVEPLALLFMHFNPDDLEDADTLLAMIETLEPPTDLAEAVQDIVRALMLVADVTRPQQPTPRRPGALRPAASARQNRPVRTTRKTR